MNVSVFLDTNILVYAVDPGDPRKHAVAFHWLGKVNQTSAGVISYQVVQEWFDTVLRSEPRIVSSADRYRPQFCLGRGATDSTRKTGLESSRRSGIE